MNYRVSPPSHGTTTADAKRVIIREDVSLSVRAPIKQEDEQEEQELKHAYSVTNKSGSMSTGGISSDSNYATYPSSEASPSHPQQGQAVATSGGGSTTIIHTPQGASILGPVYHQDVATSHTPSSVITQDTNLKTEVSYM